ncbi:VOC family protein [Microbacterium azadirachtae]|uniref:Glyoxalase-like domain protein n=1 Tax=Microbacterium azadirachtae TaxID=582680 RepID=A0A0F0LIW0_9MICO|nr:VOC family protein [Microbacterium azadirachtae]KJL31471.1 Glyoxalase-like domain protein [Microbacterium azadirachtae]
MDWKIELIFVPVTDVDRSKEFYERIGFHADHDQTPFEGLRFVQMTPPGSACSIAFGTNLGIDLEPGQQNTIQVVVPNADEALAHLRGVGAEATDVDDQAWGRFVTFADPDGNRWTLQELPDRSEQA